MSKAQVLFDETDRLQSLHEYQILDTLPEKDFDDLTKLASAICETPISMIALIDTDRQWLKSKVGIDAYEIPRDITFCAHALENSQKVFEIEDASQDEMLFNNPLVIGIPHIVFYGGVPLVNEDGFTLGVLSVIDNSPKKLNENQWDALRALANQVMAQLELRKKILQFEKLQKLSESNMKELKKFAYVVSHDLKTPLNGITSIMEELKEDYSHKLDSHGAELIELIYRLSQRLMVMINGILEYSHYTDSIITKKEPISLPILLKEITELLQIPQNFEMVFKKNDVKIVTSRIALQQILLNLCSNAVKYNDKEHGIITIDFSEDHSFYHFSVQDNGLGIQAEHQEKIFDLFQTLNSPDRFNEKGTGIGLSTVKKLIEKLDGTIHVISEKGNGANFQFKIKK